MLGGVRVGMVDGKLIANPTYEETKASKVNIVVAGTEDGIVMVESGAQQATEAEVLAAIEFGHDCCKKIAAGIQRADEEGRQDEEASTLRRAINQATVRSDLETAIRAELKDAMNTQKYEKLESYARVDACKKKAMEGVPEEQKAEAKKLFDALKERIFRDEMLKDRRRPDGRKFDEDPQDRRRSRRAAAHARFGAVHARRNAGAGHGHARHQGRRAAHRAAGFLGNLQALHAALQLPAVQRRRSRLHARRGPP